MLYFRGRTVQEVGGIEFLIHFKYRIDPRDETVGIFHETAHSVELISVTEYELGIKHKVDNLPEEAFPKVLLDSWEADIEADQENLLDIAGY
jgi:hypothetical protein